MQKCRHGICRESCNTTRANLQVTPTIVYIDILYIYSYNMLYLLARSVLRLVKCVYFTLITNISLTFNPAFYFGTSGSFIQTRKPRQLHP